MESTIEIKAGYKKTKLGWIPEEWDIHRLGDHIEIRSGSSPSSFSLSDKGKIPFIKVEDMNNCFKVQNESRFYSNDDRKTISITSIVFPKRGAAILNNKVRIVGTPLHMDSNMMALTIISDHIEPNFLYYKLKSLRLSKIADTSTIPQINNKHIVPYKLTLPPLPEQKKIADILSTWDKAIETTQALINTLQLRKKGLMQQLLTGKKRLTGFEGEWEEVKFSDVANRLTKKNEELHDNVVTISAQRGFIRQEDFFNKRVASKTLSGYYLVDKGDFCYNKSYSKGYPMGAFKRLDDFEKAVVTTLYICFRLIEEVDSDFMVYYFEGGMLVNNIMKIAQEGGRAHGLLNISLGDFFGLKMTLPKLEEQTAIAQVLTAADEEIHQRQNYLEQLQTQKKGLMQQLLTGQKRVKIV